MAMHRFRMRTQHDVIVKPTSNNKRAEVQIGLPPDSDFWRFLNRVLPLARVEVREYRNCTVYKFTDIEITISKLG